MGLLAAGGFALGLELGAAETLAAAPLSSTDTDMDGLADILEAVRWTDPYQADSDGDGFSDVEELARHGDPQDAASMPRPAIAGADVGIAPFVAGLAGAELHMVLAFYGEGSALSQRDVAVGVAVFGQLIELPPQVYLANARVSVHPAAKPGARVIVVDSVAPAGLLHALGSLSVFSTLSMVNQAPDTAATANLFSAGGVVALELVPPPSWMHHEDEDVVALQAQFAYPGPGSGGGSHTPPPTPTGAGIYRPLVPAGNVPVTWSPGEVCVQKTTTVGGSGAMTRQLVQEASCEEADASCSSACSSLAGEIIEILDPIVLIGG